MGFRGCLNDLFFVFFWLYWIYATLTETIDFRLRYKKIEAFNNKLCFWKWQPWLLLQGSFAAVLLLVLQLLWNFREPLQNRLFFKKNTSVTRNCSNYALSITFVFFFFSLSNCQNYSFIHLGTDDHTYCVWTFLLLGKMVASS